MTVPTGVGCSNVWPTVHKRSWDCCTATGSTSRAASPPSPDGKRSRNVVLCTSHGKMVLKRYRKSWRGATVTYGHSIVTHLSRVGVPVTRLVRSPTGATSVRLDDHQYALFEYVPGVNYTTRFLSPACRESARKTHRPATSRYRIRLVQSPGPLRVVKLGRQGIHGENKVGFQVSIGRISC